MAHLHISQRPDPPRMVQNKLPRETQPVSEWRLFNLHPFKRFTFPGGFDTFFFYATITTQHRQCIQCQDRTWRKRVQKTKWKQVLFYINMPIFNCCFLLPSYGLLAKPELTLKDGNSGVLSHTFLLSFFRWEEPQDRMQRNMRRNTLLHGLILHRLKTLLSQREKFYPSKGFTNG